MPKCIIVDSFSIRHLFHPSKWIDRSCCVFLTAFFCYMHCSTNAKLSKLLSTGASPALQWGYLLWEYLLYFRWLVVICTNKSKCSRGGSVSIGGVQNYAFNSSVSCSQFAFILGMFRSSVHVSGKEQEMKTRKHDIVLISFLLLGNN